MPHALAEAMRRPQLFHALLGAGHLDAAALGEDAHLLVLAHAVEREQVISLEWSSGKMKLEAWPVEPPGLGSGPCPAAPYRASPSSARW
jgi:hypothetical protein